MLERENGDMQVVLNIRVLCFFVTTLCISIGCSEGDPSAEANGHPVTIVRPVVFASETFKGPITKDQTERLMNLKVSLGGDNDTEEFFFLTDKNGKRISTTTSTEYLEAKNKGAISNTTADISMDSWFRQVAGTLKFVRESNPSKQSQWTDDILETLPVTLLNWVGSEEREQHEKDAANGINLKSYMEKGAIRKWQSNSNELSFSHNGVAYNIEIQAKGDHENDGNEDLLVMVSYYYEGGSGRGYHLYVIGKTGKSVVRQLEYYLK